MHHADRLRLRLGFDRGGERHRVLALEHLLRHAVRERGAVGEPLRELTCSLHALFGSDDAELKARKTLHSRVMKALAPKKAARYLQLESKIRAVHAYNIAATIPLLK